MHVRTGEVNAPTARRGVARTWQTGLVSAAVAVTGNAAVLGTARAAGADMLVRREVSEPVRAIGLGSVAVMTIGPILVGTLMLLLVRRWGARAWRALAVVGLAIGLATVAAPFTVLAGTSTQVGLALMHLVTGVAWFAVVRHAAARSVA